MIIWSLVNNCLLMAIRWLVDVVLLDNSTTWQAAGEGRGKIKTSSMSKITKKLPGKSPTDLVASQVIHVIGPLCIGLGCDALGITSTETCVVD